ncbi:MAG: ABC transporter permease subunit [Bacilli bacterium]
MVTRVSYRFRRKLKNALFVGVLSLMTCLAVLPLLSLVWSIGVQGIAALVGLFGAPLSRGAASATLATALLQSLMTAAASAAIAMPFGVAAAIYSSQYAGVRAARAIRFTTDILSGAPSIVPGMVVFVLLSGVSSLLAGVLALVLYMLPVVVRMTDQVLVAVPVAYMEGSLALGASRIQTIFTVVFPTAGRNLITALLFVVARMAGEAAPLLVILDGGAALQGKVSFQPLPLRLYSALAQEGSVPHPIVYAEALILLVIIVAVYGLARWVGRSNR